MTQSIYFISDLHFSHLSFSRFRQEVHPGSFSNINEHDEWLIDNWNSVVRKQRDIVWVLGDIAWNNEGLKRVKQLNGVKNLILGNHDSQRFKVQEFMRYFSSIHGVIRKYDFIMSHCPIHPNELNYHNWHTNVHGHIHHIEKQKKIEEENPGKYINVNVDILGPKPIRLEELRERIKRMKEMK